MLTGWRAIASGVVLALAALSAPLQAATWRPTQTDAFDAQLSTPYNGARPVKTMLLDLYSAPPALLQELKGRGVRTVCFVNAGAWENWRPDSGAYDLRIVGGIAGWQGERWVDVRAQDVLRPILARRLDLCKSKGFDGVAFDNTDGYAHRTGFALTAKDQLAFNRWLASEAHARDLAAGLMNTLELIPELVDDYDFAISESCFSNDGCEPLRAFRKADKSVFVIEYTNVRSKMESACAAAADLDVQLLFKTRSLNGKLHRRCS